MRYKFNLIYDILVIKKLKKKNLNMIIKLNEISKFILNFALFKLLKIIEKFLKFNQMNNLLNLSLWKKKIELFKVIK